jgi:hypothetical protein
VGFIRRRRIVTRTSTDLASVYDLFIMGETSGFQKTYELILGAPPGDVVGRI